MIAGADIFLGLSAGGVLKAELLKSMAADPLILALANPVPEVLPEEAIAVRPDAIIATGRSDYPNQVNNVLCFPYIFRGALDVGATTINEDMKLACVRALAELAMAETSEIVAKAYGGQPLSFGREYLIPKPFDPRLIMQLAPAVAQAAMDTGVATRPIKDFDAYREHLTQFVFRSGLVMKPVFERAKRHKQRLVYAEGEERRVLQAVQQVIDEGIAYPILVGRPGVIEDRIHELGLRMRVEKDIGIINIQQDSRFQDYWSEYHRLMRRKGVTPEEAKTITRTQATAVAAIAVRRNDADCALCGSVGRFTGHLQHVLDLIGKREGVHDVAGLSVLILPKGTFFICDSHVTPEPTVEDIVEMTLLAADEVRAFGLIPKVALLSRSNFGTHDSPSSQKMREAVSILQERAPTLEVEGEMHADMALSAEMRQAVFPDSRLTGQANLLIMPNVDAGHIAFNMVKALGNGVSVGPILVGIDRPMHVVNQSISVRGIVNMSAITVAQAQMHKDDAQAG